MTSKEKAYEAMSSLAQYNIMMKELSGVIDGLKAEIRQYMEAEGLEYFAGAEHAATWRPEAVRETLDSTRIKRELPEIASEYTKTVKAPYWHFA